MAGANITEGNGGTGYVVARDIVGTASAPTTGDGIQYVKLDHGAAGSSSPVTVLNPLPTGLVLQLIQITPTIDNAVAYASGDLICDVTTITSAALGTAAACKLVNVTMLDQSDNTASAYTIYVCNLSTTWGSINSAPSPADAVGAGIQAIIQIAAADWQDLGAFKIAQPVATPFTPKICETSGSANLYAVVVNGAGTPTFATSELKLTFGFEQSALS